jgi:hypothetical protein
MVRGPTFAASIAAANLRVDAATAEVWRAFEAAGVQSLLIKGIAVNRWLSSPDNPRIYSDLDLLVEPQHLEKAGEVLAELGFEPTLDEGEMPGWWREHATPWGRTRDGATVDLHRTLPGVGVEPEELWRTLSAHTETLIVGNQPVLALTVPGRAFQLALHAAQHGAGWDRVLADLERGIAVTQVATWQEAAEIASALRATPAFSAGLRLIPGGRALADHLELPDEVPVDVAIRAGTAPPVALGLDQLARAKGLRARLAILRHKLVPPPSFVRHWSPLARKGRLGLALAYLWRPVWLLTRLPMGFRSWWRARRSGSTRG